MFWNLKSSYKIAATLLIIRFVLNTRGFWDFHWDAIRHSNSKCSKVMGRHNCHNWNCFEVWVKFFVIVSTLTFSSFKCYKVVGQLFLILGKKFVILNNCNHPQSLTTYNFLALWTLVSLCNGWCALFWLTSYKTVHTPVFYPRSWVWFRNQNIKAKRVLTL